MCVVMLFLFEQIRVPPFHKSIEVGTGWGGHSDQVTIGPDLQPHQSNESPQGLVSLQAKPAGDHQKGRIYTCLFCTNKETKLETFSFISGKFEM